MPKQYGMVIDLQRCVGCGACALACKTENNTQNRANGQTFNWADFMYRQDGTFPNVAYTAIPVLCNHCADAPCVKACTVNPKAMHKTADGITMHNDERCIGCRRCQKACPYSAMDVEKEKAAYSVISANDGVKDPHLFYRDAASAIPKCTASGADVAKAAGEVPPHHHKYAGQEYESVRKKGMVEKCMFCAHRVSKGELPNCVAACPAKARIFGDLNDPGSEPAKLLKAHKAFRLKEEKGTKPNVAYIRSFRPAAKA
ncbi:MAG: 4Fe-4S dicluster domain-containing protein [Deltaproteobacteria bacterium]|nr:4Fe-4S dicluster domain-containing protein [Deltaproteobacteria bacterium]